MTSSPSTTAPSTGRRSSTRRKAPSVTSAAPSRLPSGRPKTPPALIGLAVFLMLGCGAGAGALLLSSDEAVTVVAAARDIPAGTTITAADLRPAQLSGEGLAAIPGDRAGLLLGQRVLGPVPKGTLLNAAMVAKLPVPAAGTVAVGLALEAGQLPVEQVSPGREVVVYRLSVPGGAPAASAAAAAPDRGQVLVARAQVLSVTPGTGGGVLVSVQVPDAQALAVSSASSAKLVALGLLPLGAG